MASDKLGQIYEDIPFYDNGVWTSKSYLSREEFKNDLQENYYKEPGEYGLDETIYKFQEQGIFFRENGYYDAGMDGSREFIKYWDDQKLK